MRAPKLYKLKAPIIKAGVAYNPGDTITLRDDQAHRLAAQGFITTAPAKRAGANKLEG
jgi:hypothetical protein